MRIIVSLVLFSICVAALSSLDNAFGQTAVAQAGSTGGTIGKTGKSASGGQGFHGSHVSRKRRVSVPRSEEHAKSSCAKMIGVWKGALGGDINFEAGGTVVDNHPANEGTWSCKGGDHITVTWRSADVDECTLSADGELQTCKNNSGYSFIRTRE